MEFFQKAQTIRLRSYQDKYLLANDDQKTVCLHRNGSIKNSKWEVEILENSKVIRLKSCYGKYLTASNMSFLSGEIGKKVQQTMPKNLDSSIEWEPIRDGFQVRLKSCYGKYLRADGGLPPWRNSITHDIPHRSLTKDWILWDVDIVELHPFVMKPRRQPQPIIRPLDSSLSHFSPSNLPNMDLSSLLKIELQSPSPIEIQGKLYGRLEGKKLKEETGIDDILLYCRKSLNEKRYTLQLQLPPDNADMNAVVVPSSFHCQFS